MQERAFDAANVHSTNNTREIMDDMNALFPRLRRRSSAGAAGMIALSLIACSPAASQTRSAKHSPPLAPTEPQRAGVSTERLARIDAMCEDAVKSGSIPGVVALVARHGKIIYHRAFGMADNSAARALKPDDIFRI